MRFHYVHLFCSLLKLDSFSAFVAAGAGLLVFKWSLLDVLLRVFPDHFALFRRVTRAIKNACLFFTVRRIARMSCIVSLALVSAALLGVGW